MKRLKIIGIAVVFLLLVGLVGTGCIGSGTSATAGTYEGTSSYLIRGNYGKLHEIKYTLILDLEGNGRATLQHIYKDQYHKKTGTYKCWESKSNGVWTEDNTTVFLKLGDEGEAIELLKTSEGNLEDKKSGIHLSKIKRNVPAGEEKEIPGFEALFAIVGLLVVVYILRRRNK